MLEFSDSLGWGERACAVALTVGLIFCTLFDQAKSVKK